MDSIIIPITRVPANYANAVAIISIVVLVLSWITVGLRLYVRKVLVNNVGIDDWTVVASLILFSPFCILLAVLAFGISNKEMLPSHELMNTTNILLALELFYIATIGVFKISLGYFFLRVLIGKWQRQVVHMTLIVFSVYTIGYFFFCLFQCGVPGGDRFWQRKISSKCASVASGLGLGYLHAILSACSDLLFLALPIPIVRRARLARKEKIFVGGILVVATTGCIASLIRIKWVPVLTDQSVTFFYNGIYLAIWSVLEPGLGIIASSLATLRPLVRQIVQSIRTSSAGTPSNRFSTTRTTSQPTSHSFASRFNFFFSSTGKSSNHDSHMNSSYLDPEKAILHTEERNRTSLPPEAEWRPLPRTKKSNDRILRIIQPLQEAHIESKQYQPTPQRPISEKPRIVDVQSRMKARSSSPHLPVRKSQPFIPKLSTWFSTQNDTSTTSSLPSFPKPPINVPIPVARPISKPLPPLPPPSDQAFSDTHTQNEAEVQEAKTIELRRHTPKVKLGSELPAVEQSRSSRRSQVADLRRQQNQRRQMRTMLRDPMQREGLPLGIFAMSWSVRSPAGSHRDDSSSVFTG